MPATLVPLRPPVLTALLDADLDRAPVPCGTPLSAFSLEGGGEQRDGTAASWSSGWRSRGHDRARGRPVAAGEPRR